MGYRDEIRGDVVRAATEPGALHLLVGQLGRAFDVEPRLAQKILDGDGAVRGELRAELSDTAQRLLKADDELAQRLRKLENAGGGAIDALRKEFEVRLGDLHEKLLAEMKSLLAEQWRKDIQPRLNQLDNHETRLDALDGGKTKPPKSRG